MVTIKSTNRRHEFWVSNGEYSAVKRELYRKLNAAGNFYFGVRKPVAIYGTKARSSGNAEFEF